MKFENSAAAIVTARPVATVTATARPVTATARPPAAANRPVAVAVTRTVTATRRFFVRALFGMLMLPALLAGGAASATSLAPAEGALDDTAYLLRLGLMRGHLLVGRELFSQGETAAAKTHAKHPQDEIYAQLADSFKERGARGFAAELSAHARAVESGDAAAVNAAYRKVSAAIRRHERAVKASRLQVARVVTELLRVAAEEYAIGVVDAELANAHEYQDAYGFTQVALQWAREKKFARIAGQINAVGDMWHGLTPQKSLPHAASRLYGAAARVEILALRLAAK